MIINNKIIIAIVTKDRPFHLNKLLDILISQYYNNSNILIIDNDSKKETKEVISNWKEKNKTITYINTGRNAGGAGGQHAVMAYAIANGYDAVWTMDDDCEPEENAFEEIVKYWNSLNDKENWILNSTVKRLDSEKLAFGLWHTESYLLEKPHSLIWETEKIEQKYKDNNLFPNWGCFFNGTFIPVSVMRKIGLPRPEFFIRGDEVEYMYRAIMFAKVGTVLSSVVRHPPESENFNDLPDWKKYYSIRNSIIIEQWYFPETVKFVNDKRKRWRRWKYEKFIKMLKGQKTPKVYYYGVKDAIFENFGRDAFNLFYK